MPQALIDWADVLSGLVQFAVIGLIGAMMAWLRSSYKRFKSMDDHLKALHEFAHQSAARMVRVKRKVQRHELRLRKHDGRLADIERQVGECEG